MSSPGIAVGEPHPTGTSPHGWVRSKLVDLFETQVMENYNRAFDAFLASDVDVTVNGEHLSREEYKERMQLGYILNIKHVRFDAEVEEQGKPELEGNKVNIFWLQSC